MGNKIIITTKVDADTKKVWDCYTKPEHITKWNFADPSWHCPFASNGMRIGGKYVARMEAKDGSFGFDLEAIYNEITEGKSFSFTLPDGRRVDALFEKDGNQTVVTITFDPENENPPEFQKAGWQAILDNFRKYTETN
jgi:uncharacterized protein YndB with AHSA1/START domain